MNYKKIVLLLLVVAFALTGCGDDTTYEEIQESGELVVGMSADYRPFEYVDEDNEIVGFDVDLINAVAERLDLEVVIEDTSFDGIIPGLQANEYDVIVSAMTITEDRKEAVDFSDPYFNAGQVIAVLEGNDTIAGPEDLKGKNVGVQLGTTGDITASEMDDVELTRYDGIPEAFEDLQNERIDAIVNDFPVTAEYVAERGGVEIIGEPFTEEHYGIAMRQGDDELLESINEALAEIKEDGTYDEIMEKWFEQ